MRRIIFVVCLVVSCWGLVGAAPARQVLLVPNQYPTIQAAVDAAAPGDKIMVGPGDYAGAYITRPVELKGSGPTTRITSGSPGFPSAGFYVGLDQQVLEDPGVAISEFRFESRPFPDSSGMFAGVVARALEYAQGQRSFNVEIHHNDFADGYYGVYLLNCERCRIEHNEIVNAETPIMLWAAFTAITDNITAHNTIRSDVPGNSTANWRNAGIWLNAIYGGTVGNTQVVHNTIVRTGGWSGDPAFAIYLRAAAGAAIEDNVVSFNDFRGSDNAVGASPESLLGLNVIARNLGEDRRK
jgi:hypothetical protein